MGIFDSVLFGKLHKSVGNLTMYNLNGQNIVRAKSSLGRHDKKSARQLLQRAKMKKVQQLACQLADAIAVGFPASTYNRSLNRFVGLNIGLLVTDESGGITYDADRLQLSSGELLPPQVSAVVNCSEGSVTFTRERQALRPLALDDDLVYGIVWGRDSTELQVFPLGRRDVSGGTTVYPEEDLLKFPLEIFVFAVAANGRKASSTLHLSI